MAQGKQVRPDFTRLFSRLRAFNTHQRLAVCCFMSALVNGERIAALIDQIARACSACPRCASRQSGRHGFANGLLRYRCSACGKTFNGLTGTPLALRHQ
ncbi:transposase [Massilia sp. DWR3-1-1]|uniref:transposase n=1 Tax=Massilia sp. DWR3-1-1 TaxID=2804559 RepID=UPI003CEEE89F